jgi:hypothetical protein
MDTAQKIITQIPLTELWNADGPLDARRAENLGGADIKRLLRDGPSFVVAEPGSPCGGCRRTTALPSGRPK